MRKIISCIIIAIVLTMNCNVYASSNDTLFVSRRYSDVFAVQEYKTGGHRMYVGQVYYLTKGNKTDVGYCIELGADLDAVYYSSTSDYTRFSLSKEVADYIKLIAYFGFEYKNHYDRYYYFAAQEIIWEYLTNDEIYWVDAEDYNANRIDLDAYKNEILDLVNGYYIEPSFNKEPISYGQTIELVDYNNVLNEYNIVNVNNGSAIIQGNVLRITANNLEDVELSLARSIGTSDEEMFYYADGSQSIVGKGKIDNKTIKYSFKNNGVSLKINKRDYDTGEYIVNSNVGFMLYNVDNEEYVGEDAYKINEDGYVYIDNLEKGNYRLEEVDLGIDNYLYNEEKLNFYLDETNIVYDDNYGYVYNIDFYNKKPLGRIDINKKGEEFIIENDNYKYEEISLSNVVFDIITMQEINYNEEIYYEGDVITSIKTNNNGIASIDNLPLGKYIIKEKEVDDKYELAKNEYQINLEYIDAYTNIVGQTLDIKNYLKKTKLEIIKVDSENNEPLEGVVISVYDDKDNKIYEGKTNQYGRIELDDLPYGLYYVMEKQPLMGYNLDTEKHEVVLNDKDKTLIMENKKIEMPPKTGNKYCYLSLFYIIFLSLCLFIINLCYNHNI